MNPGRDRSVAVRMRRARWSASKVTWSLIALAGGALVILALLRLTGLTSPYPLILALLTSVCALVIVAGRVEAQPLPSTMVEHPPVENAYPEADDGVWAAIRQWESRLDYVHDPHVIRPLVIDLVDERLRLDHGISRDAEPARARDLIGPQLWRYITEPPTRRLTPRDLAILVNQLEAL